MTTYYDIPTVSEREFAHPDFQEWLKQQLQTRTQANQRIYDDARRKNQQLMVLVGEVYGTTSAPYKYMRRQPVPTPPDLNRRAKKVWKRFEDWRRAKQERQRAADYRAMKEGVMA